jgi:hypothetical protein
LNSAGLGRHINHQSNPGCFNQRPVVFHDIMNDRLQIARLLLQSHFAARDP